MDKCTGVHQKTCVRASQNTIHSQSPEIAPMSIFSRVTKTVAYSHSRNLLSENEKKLPATCKRMEECNTQRKKSVTEETAMLPFL